MTATTTIENLGSAWPFPQTKTYEEYAAQKPERTAWRETCEEHYWHFLEVLPPVYLDEGLVLPRDWKGGFFCGEPADHDGRGVAVHTLFVRRGPRYFLRDVALDGAALAIEELDALLACEIGRKP